MALKRDVEVINNLNIIACKMQHVVGLRFYCNKTLLNKKEMIFGKEYTVALCISCG